MRTFAICAALLFSCTSTTSNDAAGPLEVRVLTSGEYGGVSRREAVAVFDESSYRQKWNEVVQSAEAPAIDFAQESLVFVTAGQMSTGGYSIDVSGATLEGDTLVVDAKVQGPPRGSMTTMALTAPYAVIAVRGAKFKDVRWAP
jgi:hypothetical protein